MYYFFISGHQTWIDLQTVESFVKIRNEKQFILSPFLHKLKWTWEWTIFSSPHITCQIFFIRFILVVVFVVLVVLIGVVMAAADVMVGITVVDGVTKGHLISKPIYDLLTSPKKRTDEFDLFAFLLFTANKSNSSVHFFGESTARQSTFWN